jgi:hypothetical protein
MFCPSRPRECHRDSGGRQKGGKRAGWPWAVARPGLPQIRTCAINAYGSSDGSHKWRPDASAADIFPSTAMRAGSVNTERSSKTPKYAPTRPFHPTSSFPPRGSRGSEFPRFPGTTKTLRLPAARPAALRCLRLAVPPQRSLFRPPGGRALPRAVFWSWSPGISRREQSVETAGSPTFLGNPHCALALLSDPGRTNASGHAMRRRGPRCVHDEGSRIRTFEAQSHGFGTGCLRFAGWVAPPPRKTRFRLLAKLFRTGLVTRRVPSKGFTMYPTCDPPFPSST